MPKYTNPKLPEGISSGHEHPLADVVKSSVVVIALVAAVIFGAYMGARLLAPLLPFAWERALAEGMDQGGIEVTTDAHPTQRYLTALAARVAAASDLPPDMVITVHYVEDESVNAFATLGGHVVVFSGLWKRLDSENAAAMLLGHEIAHVKYRDPIRSTSGVLLASLAVGILFGDIGIVDDLASMGSVLTALHFSREQERQADSAAARAVYRLYGHLDGATDLFDQLRNVSNEASEPPALISSHPHLGERIASLRREAGHNGWTFEGDKKPLPDTEIETPTRGGL